MDDKGAGNSNLDLIIVPQVPLTQFFNTTLKGNCVAKGVGMRNRGFGTIDFTGLIPARSTIVNSFLYWEVLRTSAQASDPKGTLNGTPIIGDNIAPAIGNPCWNTDVADVFRADVTGIATGGVNTLTGFPSGDTDSSSPFSSSTPPLIEGASIIHVYSNRALPLTTVIINNGGVTFTNDTVSTTLTGFSASPPVSAKTIYIVGDGQAAFAGDQALFNSAVVAGPTTLVRPADAFNGQDGIDAGIDPVTGLWDTLTLDVSSLINPNDRNATASVLSSSIGGDCLTYIAQILCVKTFGK